MNPFKKNFLFQAGSRRRRSAAFTITELMVATSVFSFVIIGIIIVQLFGMKMYQIAEVKLSAAANGRRALNRVRGDILEGDNVTIQTGNNTFHSDVANFTPQSGNAVKIGLPSSTNFVLYFTDSSSNCLKRFSSSDNRVEVVARYLMTNQAVFQAEDYQGNVLVTNQNNRVIRMFLEFSQWEYPGAAGSGGVYDTYRIQTRTTCRLLE